MEHAPAYRHGMLWPWREKDEDHEHDRCPIFLWDGVQADNVTHQFYAPSGKSYP
jgi:hypothetical protein